MGWVCLGSHGCSGRQASCPTLSGVASWDLVQTVDSFLLHTEGPSCGLCLAFLRKGQMSEAPGWERIRQ